MPFRFSARLKLRVSRFPLFCISYLHAMRSKSPAPGLSGRNYPSAPAINKNASQMPPANFHSKGRLEVWPIIQKWARISNFPEPLRFLQMTARTSGSFEESLIRALKRELHNCTSTRFKCIFRPQILCLGPTIMWLISVASRTLSSSISIYKKCGQTHSSLKSPHLVELQISANIEQIANQWHIWKVQKQKNMKIYQRPSISWNPSWCWFETGWTRMYKGVKMQNLRADRVSLLSLKNLLARSVPVPRFSPCRMSQRLWSRSGTKSQLQTIADMQTNWFCLLL